MMDCPVRSSSVPIASSLRLRHWQTGLVRNAVFKVGWNSGRSDCHFSQQRHPSARLNVVSFGRPPVKEISMILWNASSIWKCVSLLGLLVLSICLPTGTHTYGQAATAPAASTASARKTIQTAQERLLALGYQPGSADGVMGTRAIAALKKFQSDHSLPVTGQLDRKTLTSGPGAKTVKRKLSARGGRFGEYPECGNAARWSLD